MPDRCPGLSARAAARVLLLALGVGVQDLIAPAWAGIVVLEDKPCVQENLLREELELRLGGSSPAVALDGLDLWVHVARSAESGLQATVRLSRRSDGASLLSADQEPISSTAGDCDLVRSAIAAKVAAQLDALPTRTPTWRSGGAVVGLLYGPGEDLPRLRLATSADRGISGATLLARLRLDLGRTFADEGAWVALGSASAEVGLGSARLGRESRRAGWDLGGALGADLARGVGFWQNHLAASPALALVGRARLTWRGGTCLAIGAEVPMIRLAALGPAGSSPWIAPPVSAVVELGRAPGPGKSP